MGELGWSCDVSLLTRGGEPLARIRLAGPGNPDLSTVDLLARFTLLAVRIGVLLVVEDAPPALRSLLELAALGVEMQGQAEAGEEPLRLEEVQEEAQLRDLAP